MTATLSKPEASQPAPAPSLRSRIAGSDGLVTVLAVVIALVIGAILMVFSDDQARRDLGSDFGSFLPRAWDVVSGAYSAMFQGSIFSLHTDGSATGMLAPIASSIAQAGPLILAGLGVTLAFRAGLFNIGAEGQITAGATAAGAVGFGVDLPVFIHLVAAIVAGFLGGAVWGLIAGALKAKTGAHEVITTIMLNYVASFGLLYMLQQTWFQGTDNQQSKVIDGSARLPHLLGGNLPVDLAIVLGIAAAAFLWWLLSRSTAGFRLRAAGQNPAAARTAGMNIGNTTMLAFAIAGGLAGLAGVALALGSSNSYQVTQGISSNIGFDAITVALLGRMKPWPTFWAGMLFGVLRAGGTAMQAQVQIPVDIVLVMQAVIVVFIAAPRLTRATFRIKATGRALQTAATNLAVTVSEKATSAQRKRVVAGSAQIVLGLLGLLVFGLGDRASGTATFELSLSGAAVDLGAVEVQVAPVTITLTVLVVLAGIARVFGRLSGKWAATIAVLGLLISFIFWSVSDSPNGLNVVSLVQGSIFPLAIPIILGAMAGVLGERAGVVNVAIEGQLLFGAFVAALIGTIATSAWAGAIAGVAAGVLIAALLAVLAIRYLVDQVIVGVVLNVLVLGLTTFLYQKVMQPNADTYNRPTNFDVLQIPGLVDIPIIGPALFEGTIFLFATYVIVALVWISLFRTRWGLRVRAVGEHPRAADTVGIKVLRTRYRTVLLAGAIAGLGGAFLVVGSGVPSQFSINMSSGQGFIALAAVIFGRWHPRGAVLAALLFGFANQLQSLLQQADSPIDSNLLLMAPYLVTLLAVAGFIGRSRPPAADGQPYTSRS